MADCNSLCRDLTPGEQAWLSQSSLICIVAKLSSELSGNLTDENVQARIMKCRSQQPFLSVAIDVEALKFKKIDSTPFTTAKAVDHDQATITAIARKELEAGVDRATTLARVHLVRSAPDCASLILLGDHLCFDGKSLMTFLSELTAETEGSSDGGMLEFVDWTSKIPPIEFSPFEPPCTSVKMPTKAITDPASLATSVIEDKVVNLGAEVLAQLKERTKEHDTTLNAPLQIAFLAACADAAFSQMESVPETPISARTVAAVDLRGRLGLPASYMNNSASVVPVHTSFAEVKDGKVAGDLWTLALSAQKILTDNIEAGEAYRLNDITKRGAFAEFGPYFDILCLWSNMGFVKATGVEGAEVHLRGAGSNPIISGHPITCNGSMSLTLTYAPAFHDTQTIEYIGERFAHHVSSLAQ